MAQLLTFKTGLGSQSPQRACFSVGFYRHWNDLIILKKFKSNLWKGGVYLCFIEILFYKIIGATDLRLIMTNHISKK